MNQRITIYTRTDSPSSVDLIRYLDDHQISYENVVLDGNARAVEALLNETEQTDVPVLIARSSRDERIVIGFDPERIEEALELRRIAA